MRPKWYNLQGHNYLFKKKRESKERGNRVETWQPKGIIKKCWKTNFSDFSRPTSIFFSQRSGFVVLFVYSGLL